MLGSGGECEGKSWRDHDRLGISGPAGSGYSPSKLKRLPKARRRSIHRRLLRWRRMGVGSARLKLCGACCEWAARWSTSSVAYFAVCRSSVGWYRARMMHDTKVVWQRTWSWQNAQSWRQGWTNLRRKTWRLTATGCAAAAARNPAKSWLTHSGRATRKDGFSGPTIAARFSLTIESAGFMACLVTVFVLQEFRPHSPT